MTNVLGVLAATVASYVLGALWFSPLLFGNVWAKLSGMDKKIKDFKKSDMNKAYVGNFLTTLVTAYVLSLFLNYTNSATVASALQVALLVWVGFLATTQMGSIFWEQKPFKLYLITTLHGLVSLLLMAVVLVLV